MQEEKEVRECGSRRNLNKNTKYKQTQLMQQRQSISDKTGSTEPTRFKRQSGNKVQILNRKKHT